MGYTQIGGDGVSPALVNYWYKTLKSCTSRIEFDWSDRKPSYVASENRIVFSGKVKISYPHLNDEECAHIASYFKFVGDYADRMRDHV